jgi:protein SCO1
VSRRHPVLVALAVALCAALCVLATTPGTARADGDPASDYLYTQSVFLPAGTSPAIQSQLRAVVRASTAAGAPIKVAVIGSAYDLGSITPLWQKPQTYAHFLGVELSFRYHGLLLIVMPNGFGLNDRSSAVARERRALAGLHIGSGSAGLAAAAEAAVRKLAAVRGHPLPGSITSVGAPHRAGRGTGAWWLSGAAIAAGLLAIAAAWTVSLRIRPLRWPRWVPRLHVPAPAIAMLLAAVALGASAGIVVAVKIRHPPPTQPATSPASAGGLSWPAGSRPAPDFQLRDQSGSEISMRSLRGRVVILAFLDPVCRNLCPLEAAILGQVERRFTASSRPVVVAVSVNPWGDSHANLTRDIRRWRVGPGWRWAVGPRAALSRVWHAYKVGVQARRVRVGKRTVHEISHDELIYVIDPRGFERSLYPYPFSVVQVVSAVRHAREIRT